MVKAHVERVIDVPLDRAWELFSDFYNVHKIHPVIEKVTQVTKDKDCEVGAIRLCHMYDGNEVTEGIVEWDGANHSYKVQYKEGTVPLATMMSTLRCEAVGSKQSKLICEMDFTAKYGLLGMILEYLVLKPKLGGAVGDMMAGVEDYDKTGAEIQQGYKAKTPALIV